MSQVYVLCNEYNSVWCLSSPELLYFYHRSWMTPGKSDQLERPKNRHRHRHKKLQDWLKLYSLNLRSHLLTKSKKRESLKEWPPGGNYQSFVSFFTLVRVLKFRKHILSWYQLFRDVWNIPDSQGPAVPWQGMQGEHGGLVWGARVEHLLLLQLLQCTWRYPNGGNQEKGILYFVGKGYFVFQNIQQCFPQVESKAQSIVANIRIYEGILMNLPAVLYCFLAGDWLPIARKNLMYLLELKRTFFF